MFLIGQEKEAAKELEGVPDEEGWIKVTRLSKNTAPRTQSNDKRKKRKLKKRNREKVQIFLICIGYRCFRIAFLMILSTGWYTSVITKILTLLIMSLFLSVYLLLASVYLHILIIMASICVNVRFLGNMYVCIIIFRNFYTSTNFKCENLKKKVRTFSVVNSVSVIYLVLRGTGVWESA